MGIAPALRSKLLDFNRKRYDPVPTTRVLRTYAFRRLDRLSTLLVRRPPVKYLVLCPCGHAMDVHVPAGCKGAQCECLHNESAALEAAIAEAGRNVWVDGPRAAVS